MNSTKKTRPIPKKDNTSEGFKTFDSHSLASNISMLKKEHGKDLKSSEDIIYYKFI